MPIKLTERQYVALHIIQDLNKRRCFTMKRFAELMWPESAMHTRHYKCGHGTRKGSGAMCAGGYLARLRNAGLISIFRPSRLRVRLEIGLTVDGKRLLQGREVKSDAVRGDEPSLGGSSGGNAGRREETS